FGLVNDSTGYIYLPSFTDKSANDVRTAIIELKNKGAKSLILDLRGNSGGLLDQAVEIVNFFVPKNSKVVSTRGKVKQWDKEYNAEKNPIAPDMPLAVLIDRGSASASEIVSGALQDLDRAVLVGERSFGKGLVQTVRDLSYNTKLKVTTAKYYIPSGRCIQALDYSHRNPDGSVGKVPDSLITEYATKNGRKVYDGGGISPDVKVEAEEYARITQELVLQDLTFDFVNNYALRHPEIPAIKDFKVSDDIYNQFKQYLKEKNFSYETSSQQMLEKLIETAKAEKYFDASKEEIEKLQKEFAHSIDRDMNLFKEEIMSFLAEQFIQRYYYQEGVIEYKMMHDKEVAKAVEILADRNEYQKLLK
ncbi:MAG: peptidase S41, partial [Odoribacter sp.]|nr:peptidase S41 [Odoribacter sp.]